MVTVNVVVLAGTVAADPVERRMPSGDEVTVVQTAYTDCRPLTTSISPWRMQAWETVPFGGETASSGSGQLRVIWVRDRVSEERSSIWTQWMTSSRGTNPAPYPEPLGPPELKEWTRTRPTPTGRPGTSLKRTGWA